MDEIIQGLKGVGFSEKEARVYLALLEVGQSGAQLIAKRSGINRATTYAILDTLSGKGLVSPCLKNSERQFIAEPPERVLTLLHLQQQELEARRRRADQLMLQLQAFYNANPTKPRIRYIESVEGLRAMQREYEELDEDIIQLVGYDTYLKFFGGFSEDHVGELERQQRKIKCILTTDRRIEIPADLNVQYVTISPSLVDIQGEMTVCGDRVVLFSYSNGVIAVEIKSPTIAETARAALELAWREAERWQNQKDAD